MEALRWQNGLEMSYTRGVFHALGRFGVREATVFDEIAPYLSPDALDLLKKNRNAAFYEPLVSDWSNFGQWTEAGSRDATQRANETWKRVLAEVSRMSSSADASVRATKLILASLVMGSLRSLKSPSSCMATVRLASEGEMPLAMSRPVVPWAYSRRAPSGKVTATIPFSFCSLAAYECR